jgi:hypothetical protein
VRSQEEEPTEELSDILEKLPTRKPRKERGDRGSSRGSNIEKALANKVARPYTPEAQAREKVQPASPQRYKCFIV